MNILADQWAFWSATLAGDKPEPPLHPGADGEGIWDVPVEALQSGFWRFDRAAVAIWRDDAGALFILRDGMPTKPAWVCGRWPRMYRSAITKEAHDAFLESGQWPDDPPARDHNLPTDPFERSKLLIEAEAADVAAFVAVPITTKEAADKAASWAERVAKLAKEADAERAAEKKPHDDAGKAVQAKWSPLVAMADAMKRNLKRALEPYLIAEQRKEAEARAASAQAGKALEAPRNASAGRTGAKVALRSRTVALVEDLPAFVAYLAAMESPPPDLVTVCNMLALRMVSAGVEPPGVKKSVVQQAA
jgi:hypothetical protein